MRAAADGEDGSVKHVAMENRLYPMRELLGELLLQMGQAAPALREFEASLKETPNRYRGLYGPRARRRQPATARRRAGTSRSSSHWRRRRIPRGRKSRPQRRSSASVEPRIPAPHAPRTKDRWCPVSLLSLLIKRLHDQVTMAAAPAVAWR